MAVIGCGRIAGHNCKAINETSGVRLTAVCDLLEDKASACGEEYGVSSYTNYHEMFRLEPDIDIVTICTPSGMHFEHATDIIRRYNKSVVVEKPTFMRLDQMQKVYQLARERGVVIYPVFQNRYNKAVRYVREALANGQLGEIRIINVIVRWCRPQRYYDLSPWRGTFSHDGGALTNQGIHHVDLMRHLGGEVARVHANMRTLGAEIEVEDAIVAILNYRSGAIGSVEVTTAARPDDFEASITIIGSKGLARIGGIAVNELQIFTPDPAACASHSEEFVGIKGLGAVYGYGHSMMYEDISCARRGIASYPIDEDECRRTLSLLHSFYRSDECDAWVDPGEGLESRRLGCVNEVISELYRVQI